MKAKRVVDKEEPNDHHHSPGKHTSSIEFILNGVSQGRLNILMDADLDPESVQVKQRESNMARLITLAGLIRDGGHKVEILEGWRIREIRSEAEG